MKNEITRRSFVKTTLATTAVIGVAPLAGCNLVSNPYDAKGLPTRPLGKTGAVVPIIGFGCGSRWMGVADDDKALEILEHALNNGLYYWDTAANYGNDRISSEERVGMLLKSRRDEVFLTTKVRERKADEARATIERSLERLQTDHINLLHVHAIESVEDAEALGEKGNLLEVLHDYRSQGIVKNIGFTGHLSADGMKRAAELYDFDAMMIAMNHQVPSGNEPFEEHAVPFAANKGMAVIAMKVVRPRETVKGLGAEKLIRYALSSKYFSLANIGTDSMEVLNANLDLIRNFKPLEQNEMEEVKIALNPFFRHKNVPWMAPSYMDGIEGGISLA